MESLIFIVSLNILSNIPLKTFQRHSEPNQFYSFNQTSSLVTLTLAYFISLTSPECDCCQQSHIRFHTSSVQGKMSCSIIDVPLLPPPPPRQVIFSHDFMLCWHNGRNSRWREKINSCKRKCAQCALHRLETYASLMLRHRHDKLSHAGSGGQRPRASAGGLAGWPLRGMGEMSLRHVCASTITFAAVFLIINFDVPLHIVSRIYHSAIRELRNGPRLDEDLRPRANNRGTFVSMRHDWAAVPEILQVVKISSGHTGSHYTTVYSVYCEWKARPLSKSLPYPEQLYLFIFNMQEVF